MQLKNEIDLDQLIQAILKRSTSDEHLSLGQLLTNVKIFIKRARSETLTENEKEFSDSPFFAPHLLGKGSEVADALQRRLEIINQYQVTEAERIYYIITSTSLDPYRPIMSNLKKQVLREFFDNPNLSQKELALRLGFSPRRVKSELNELRRDFAVRRLTFIDPQKLKLMQKFLFFQTKSLDASTKFEQTLRETKPLFLHRIAFDHDYRQGYLVYYVPIQPQSARLYNNRMQAYRDEFFNELHEFQFVGHYVQMALEGYDHYFGKWMLGTDVRLDLGQALVKRLRNSAVEPRGIDYEIPIRFDRIDFLLAQMAFVDSGPKRIDYRQKVLERFGFKISKKTIWVRERKLHKANVFFPTIYFQIPQFEEFVMFVIQCSAKAQETVWQLSKILPYSMINPMSNGVYINFQRPTRCAGIIEQLVQVIGRKPDVEDIHVLRLPITIGISMILDAVSRWDTSRQRWLPQEQDF